MNGASSASQGSSRWASFPAVGDFNGDGRTDIACHVPTVTGNGSLNGILLDGLFTVLTTNANVNPAGDDWPLVNRDPQNSRSRLVATATLPQPATNPSPANGATGVGTGATLAWTAGAGATSHDVYFGTANPPAFRVNQTGTTFNPGALAANTTYFWRIDGKNTAGTGPGRCGASPRRPAARREQRRLLHAPGQELRPGERHRQLRRGAHRLVVRNVHVAADLRRRWDAQRLRRRRGARRRAATCARGRPRSRVRATTPATSARAWFAAKRSRTSAARTAATSPSGRTFRVNNELRTCNGGNITLPAKRNGGYCFQASTGDFAWAYFTTW